MFYNLTSVIRYREGVLGATDCPLRDAHGTVLFAGAELHPAFLRLTEEVFAIFHFDLALEPMVKLQWLTRYSQVLQQTPFENLMSVDDIASRCSGALSQNITAAELNSIPPIGLIVSGFSSYPTRDMHIVGMHTHSRIDPNVAFSQLRPFAANCYGGTSCVIAQSIDTKIFSRYFNRDQALRMLYLQHQISHRSLFFVKEIAGDLDVVEVANDIPFRRVPREDLANARAVASTYHQSLDLSCKPLIGAVA